MSQHTPGPWHVRIWATEDDPDKLRAVGLEPVPALSNDGKRAIWAGEDKVIAEVHCQTEFKRGHGYETHCPEREANARLIAAAPMLLYTAKHLRSVVKNGHSGKTLQVALDDIDAAIAHAEQP